MTEVPHNRLTFGNAECDSILRTVRSGQWAQGPRVEELERVLARIAGVQHAVCVGSGLAALRLSLGALNVAAGDRVLVPAYSCVALANAALSWCATPVPIDVEPENWTIDSAQSLSNLKDGTAKAGIAVNTFGTAACIKQSEGLTWIEDCAHAFGIQVDGKAFGARAEIGVLSFHATKLIGGGEGGAVLSNSSQIADFVRSSRDYGDQPEDPHRLNDKMTDLEAALVLAQLERLPNMIAGRKALAERYIDRLGRAVDTGSCQLSNNRTPRIWYRFAVEMLTVPAKTVVNCLIPLGINAAIPVTDWRTKVSAAPVADRAYRSLVSLPLYPTLTEREQDAVIAAFTKLCEEYSRG